MNPDLSDTGSGLGFGEDDPLAFASLCLVADLYKISLPAQVLKNVRPDAFRRFWHERYMPEKWIFSMSIKRWTAFSFIKRPLSSYNILNFLVMGRRTEKLHYLLRRIFFPPPEWLRDAYHLPANRILAPYYLMRAFILFFHTLGSIINTIFGIEGND